MVGGTNGVAKWNNIFHVYFGNSGFSQAQLDTFRDQFEAAYKNNLLSHQANSVVVTQCIVTDLTTSSSLTSAKLNYNDAGGGGASASSADDAIVIGWRIARRYRGGHPRSYLPGPLSGQYADTQHFAGGYVTSLSTDAAGFIAAVNALVLNGGTIQLVNVSYFKGFTNVTKPSGRQVSRPSLRPTPVVDIITAAHVDRRICGQSRRLGRALT